MRAIFVVFATLFIVSSAASQNVMIIDTRGMKNTEEVGRAINKVRTQYKIQAVAAIRGKFVGCFPTLDVPAAIWNWDHNDEMWSEANDANRIINDAVTSVGLYLGNAGKIIFLQSPTWRETPIYQTVDGKKVVRVNATQRELILLQN